MGDIAPAPAEPRDIGSLPVPTILGARPLRKPEHERYARARSLLLPRVEAYRQAGLGGTDYAADRGNAAKLERKRAVLDRIAFLTHQPEEVLKAKRERIEAFLWAVHETDYTEFYRVVEIEEFDEEGEPTGVKHKQQWLRPFDELTEDQRRLVQGLKYTEKGRPILELPVKTQANIELRKLLGIGRVDQDDEASEFSRLPDHELFAELAREAKELGIDVELTFKASGASA